MVRRGRKRKSGQRYRSGDLVRARGPSVAEVAAGMPHRKGLKQPSDPHAESELGRIFLRGEITSEQEAAGELYRKEWRSYIESLCAPKAFEQGSGGINKCALCSPEFCLCQLRKRRWDEARAVLKTDPIDLQLSPQPFVEHVVLHDRPLAPGYRWILRLGLGMLARYYGLTARTGSVLGKAVSQKHR